ncbi:hypothetical protein F2P56_007910 [Juglans regia]|uniref:Protein FAR1-RELATED SEQUENCE n=2 Tax=Juglans regia TaxID=51240 RepID=A0A833Y693_JUGRE|nr:protein FAR-RED IMPAIRED RESPONSE 1-like [Juglans regia]KAF5476175.1 hypothetical protein F2P56_007910 [Juglans regia]
MDKERDERPPRPSTLISPTQGEAKGTEAEGTNQVSDDEGVEEPKPGMEFATDKEFMAYYKRYTKQQGFSVIIQRTKREADESAKYLTIGCARGGKYHPSRSNISRSRPTTKTDCMARINTHLVKSVWVVTTVEIAHNHSTFSLQKFRFFRSYKCLDEYSQMILDFNERASIRMNNNFGAIVADARGDFQEKDCRNFMNKARQLRLGKGGGDALIDYFKRMRLINDVDEDLRIINVFWTDARSRATYEYFGDVITFNTTYLTNKYGIPFAPFVGVNHHGQSILLGVDLISSEDTATFVWLFRTWLQCMDDRAPKAIITDQDRAMKSAIALKYDQGDNASLQELYNERSFWVPTYLKGLFWASMSITQRFESMNAFFDGFVHSGMTLKEFVDQFDNASRKKV